MNEHGGRTNLWSIENSFRSVGSGSSSVSPARPVTRPGQRVHRGFSRVRPFWKAPISQQQYPKATPLSYRTSSITAGTLFAKKITGRFVSRSRKAGNADRSTHCASFGHRNPGPWTGFALAVGDEHLVRFEAANLDQLLSTILDDFPALRPGPSVA